MPTLVGVISLYCTSQPPYLSPSITTFQTERGQGPHVILHRITATRRLPRQTIIAWRPMEHADHMVCVDL